MNGTKTSACLLPIHMILNTEYNTGPAVLPKKELEQLLALRISHEHQWTKSLRRTLSIRSLSNLLMLVLE